MAILNFSKKKKAKPAAAKKLALKAAKQRIVKKKIIKHKTIIRVQHKKAAKKGKKTIAKKKVLSSLPKQIISQGDFVGKVTHYFSKARAAVVKLTKGGLSLGDKIYIKGHTSDFSQVVNSLQIDRRPIKSAKKGDEAGIGVNARVRIHDDVYKIVRLRDVS